MNSQELTHPHLVHPRTGEPLRAIAVHPLTGRPVWPIMGGDGTEDDANDDTGTEDESDTGDSDDDSQDDSSDDTGSDDARIKRANKQAAKYRTDLRTTQAQLAAATAVLDKLKGAFGDDEDTDPSAQVTKATERVADLEAQTAALNAELLVTKLAPKLKANAEALLDSQKFTKALAELDPDDDTYSEQVADAIEKAVKNNAAYRLGSAKGGAELDAEKRESAKGKRSKGLAAAIGAAYK